MFTISVETLFRASHRLTLPDGSKEAEHHHDWQVTAKLCSQKLDQMGLVMDFRRLKACLDNIVAEFGSPNGFERIDYFKENNPSAENVARYIFERLEPKLPQGVKLHSIRVVEEPGCSAEFTPE